MYALTTTAGVDAVGPLPRTARRLDTGQWVTPPPDGWTDELALACGWLPVVESPRPTDTATHTSEAAYAVDGATVVQSWTPRPWTAEEVAARFQAAAMLTDLAARVARIEAELWPPQPDTTPSADIPTMTGYEGTWPAGALLLDGGKTWRNISGVPLTTAPSGFPGEPSRWAHLFVLAAAATQPPAVVSAWSATATYKVGDRVTRGGVTYECLVAHGAEYAGTWGPPLASVWTVV